MEWYAPPYNIYVLFKGLRQCADPFKWLLQNRGYEKNYMSAVSTAKACPLQALGFEDSNGCAEVFLLRPIS